MNKSDLVEFLSEQLAKTKKETADFVDAVLDTITTRVAKGEKVSLSGFGVFEKQSRAARVGRNPRTGQTVKIKATSVPKFRPGVDLKLQVAGKKRPARKNAAAPVTARKTTATKAAPAKKTTAAAKKAAPVKKTTTAAKKAAPVKKTTAAAKKAAPVKKTTTARKTTASKTAATKTTARKTTARKTTR